ncbi:hypothetical protein MASR2M17_18370 [Aminivibrio sp.]
MSLVDISGAEAPEQGLKMLKERGTDVIMCALPKGSMKMMERYGICDLSGRGTFTGAWSGPCWTTAPGPKGWPEQNIGMGCPWI